MGGLGVIDLIIIGIILLSILTGMVRGFVKELIAICVWIAAIWLGINYSHYVGVYLQDYISDGLVRNAVAFVIILLISILSGSLVNAVFSFILKSTGLNGTDRLLGMVFGCVRGVLLVSLLILAIKITNVLPVDNYISKSVLYDKFTPIVNWLYSIAPDFIKNAGNNETGETVNQNI